MKSYIFMFLILYVAVIHISKKD